MNRKRSISRVFVQIIVLASILAANLVPVFACHPVVGGDCEKAWAQAVASSGTMKVWIDDVLVLDQYVQDGDYFEWTEADGIDFCAEHEIRAEYFGQTSTVTFGGSHCCPTYSVSANGTCSSHGASGHSDTSALLRVTGTDANGDAISHEETVNGSFSSTWNNVDPGVYGPNPVHVVAELLVNSKVVKSDTFDDSLICGSAEYSLSLNGTCSGGTANWSADTKVLLEVSGTDANGGPINVSLNVDPGSRTENIAWTNPGTYGPHPVTMNGTLKVNDEVVASASFDKSLNCGEATYSVSANGTCSSHGASGYTDKEATLKESGTDANGDTISHEEAVHKDFSFDWSNVNPGVYGPNPIRVVAKLVINDETVASDTYEDSLICGMPQGNLSVSVSCQGLEISGNTDETTVINWDFQNESGITNVEAGSFSFKVGTPLTTYGPHKKISGNASMDVGGVIYSDSDTMKDAICGPAQGNLEVSVSCQGIKASGYSDVATLLKWTFQSESGITRVGPGTFKIKAGTLITSGTHDLVGWASIVIYGKIFSDTARLPQAVCGPKEDYELAASCLPDGRAQGWAHANSTWIWGRMFDGKTIAHEFDLQAGQVFSFTTSYILYEAETWAYSVTSPKGTETGLLALPRCKEPEREEPCAGIWGRKSIRAPYWLIAETVQRFAETEVGKMYRLDALRLVDGTPFADFVPNNPDQIVEVWGAGFHASVGGRAEDIWFEGSATSDGWDGIFSVDLKGEHWFKEGAYAAALYRGFVPESPFEVIAREHGIEWKIVVVEAPNGIGDSERVLLSESPLPKNDRSYVGWWRNEWVPKPPEGGRSEISFINGQVVGSVFGAELLFKGNDLDEPGWNQAALFSGRRIMLHLNDNTGQARAGAQLNDLIESDIVAVDLGEGMRLYKVIGKEVVEQSYEGFSSLYTTNGYTLFTCHGAWDGSTSYSHYLAVQVVAVSGLSLIQ